MSWLLSNSTEEFRAEERAWANGRHGTWTPPPPEKLLDEDWELWLAAGPLRPDLCDCEALCECDQEETET